MLEIEVLSKGLYDTLQDEGRPGHQSYGVPVGGAIDRKAAMLANQLVGNAMNTPVLESTLVGPRLLFHEAAQIALTGARTEAKINGAPIPIYSTVNIKPGDMLNIGRMQHGCRTYLAVNGTWMVTKWLDSCSPPPYQANQLTPDSHLQKGNRISILQGTPIRIRSLRGPDWDQKPEISTIRAFRGPESEWFSERSWDYFFQQVFTLSKAANRMGIRLQEAIPGTENLPRLISSATLPGTVQLPSSGVPILLMADAQTTGGYPRMAQILTEDLPKLAQLRPGDQIRFNLLR